MLDVRPLAYQEEIRECLKAEESELWRWFSSEKFLDAYADDARLEILKCAYRLDRENHGALYAQADQVRARLELSAPLTLYQSQLSTQLNASLSYLPCEAHLIFSGPILTTLAPTEVQWVMGHELSHFMLFDGFGGEFLVTDQILHAMASSQARFRRARRPLCSRRSSGRTSASLPSSDLRLSSVRSRKAACSRGIL